MFTLCPDCDTPLPELYHSYNSKRKTYHLSRAGKLNCSGCNTLLIITLINGEFQLRTKEQRTPFQMPRGHKQYELSGMPLECDPGHEIAPKIDHSHGLVCCVKCSNEIQSTINTIRVRIMKGTMRIERPTEDLDPAGNPIMITIKVPTYETGRLCKVCQATMNESGHTDSNGEHITAPRANEYEYLHERIKHRKAKVVTRGSIKSLDLELKREKEAQRLIDMGDITIAAPEIPGENHPIKCCCKVCSLAVDTTAFRSLNRMGSKSKHHVDFNERNR